MRRLVIVCSVVALSASVCVALASATPADWNGAPGTGPCVGDVSNRTQSILPQDLDIPIPYPAITTVPTPATESAPVRVPQESLPTDPCVDPCPDLTDQPPEPGAGSSSAIRLPRIGLDLNPFYFGIPVPNPNAPPPQPVPDAVSPPVEPAVTTPALAAPRVGAVTRVAKETGAGSINRTDKRWQVQGTDLGIMWESAPGQIAAAFGDTIGKGFHPPGGQGEDWRSNVLAFSTDKNLSDGMSIDSMVQDSRCHAAELLSNRGLDNIEITTIPTSGFAIGSRQYMSYMSIRTWNSIPATWWTNYGGLAYSDDGGSTWVKDDYAKWDNIFGVSNFQVASMVPAGDYVYLFGTPNTRLGAVGLARVPRDQVLNKTAYQYFSNGSWTPVGGANAATPIVNAPAAELSVRYDSANDRWQMSYLDTAKAAIVLR